VIFGIVHVENDDFDCNIDKTQGNLENLLIAVTRGGGDLAQRKRF
jgi:hypothetical protein